MENSYKARIVIVLEDESEIALPFVDFIDEFSTDGLQLVSKRLPQEQIKYSSKDGFTFIGFRIELEDGSTVFTNDTGRIVIAPNQELSFIKGM